jgi:hypothetical protein
MIAITFLVEVEKGLDWNAGYLNYDNEVVEDIKEAYKFEDEEEANNAAHFFNQKYNRGLQSKIYARVR